jgi:long-chain fatty acid transport protein
LRVSTASTRRRIQIPLLVLLLTVSAAPWARAQSQPEIQPDERDFEGLTSLSLGSGARAFGMGGAFLARPDDATAASWNPAGLSYLRRPELSLVGVRNSFDRTASGDQFLSTDQLVGYTPDLGAFTYPVTIGRATGAVQISFQRIFSFRGRRNIHTTEGNRASFVDLASTGRGGFDVVALAAGLQLTRSLRLGVTLNDWVNGYRQNRTKTFDPEVTTRVQIQDIQYALSGLSTNLGVIWSPWESLNLGLVAKTGFTGKLTVSRHRKDIDEEAEFLRSRTETRDNLELDFPRALGGGISWRVSSPLTVSADYTRTSWSDGEIRNFFLVPGPPLLPNEAPLPVRNFDSLPYPSLAEGQRQFDTEQVRMGAEFVALRRSVRWPVRAGFFTDRQFFADRAGQTPSYTGFTVGTGLGLGSVLLDVAYLQERGRYVDTEGRNVSTRFHRVFVSVIYRRE